MTGRRRHPLRSAALCLLVGLAMLASLAGSAIPARAQDDPVNDNDGGNNVEGNTYTSPDFGFAITWDRTWDATEDVEDTDPTYNSVTLENDVSTISISGTGVAVDPSKRVEAIAAVFEELDGASNVELVDDDLTGDVADATYTLDFEDDGGDVSAVTIYVQCQSLLGGEATLDIIHSALTEDYEDQIAEREDLLDGLALDGTIPEVEGGEPDEAPADDGAADSTDLDQTSIPGGDGDRPSNDEELVDLIDSSIVDLNGYWARQFPLLAGGDEYTPPADWVTWTGTVDSACGAAVSFTEDFDPGVGPFYCPPDQTVYYDLNFANYQLEFVPNSFVISAVMAHELGHHIQELLGLEVCTETPCLDRDLLTSQEIEYMADCWAGAWAADAELRGRLGSGDIDATIVEYALVIGGDGFESADIGGHGRGSERIWWFLNGYIEGAARCLDTSSATAELLDETPTAGEETPVADETEAPVGVTVGLNEIVDLGDYTFKVTQTDVRDAIDTEDPDEDQFFVVFFEAEIGADDGGPFDYSAWTLVDGDGITYEVDETATNQLLSSAYADGIEQDLAGGSGHQLAMVFDVPAGITGLTLDNADASVTIELGI